MGREDFVFYISCAIFSLLSDSSKSLLECRICGNSVKDFIPHIYVRSHDLLREIDFSLVESLAGQKVLLTLNKQIQTQVL